MALWFNPEYEDAWRPGESVCYSEVTPQVVDPKAPESAAEGCQLIVVERPAEKAPPEAAPSESRGE